MSEYSIHDNIVASDNTLYKALQSKAKSFLFFGQEKQDVLIQELENQIRELKQQKLELEQKVSLLEWQLENMKQKLELQEICHRREISTLNEKVSDQSLTLFLL